jgi:hypothetical protein
LAPEIRWFSSLGSTRSGVSSWSAVLDELTWTLGLLGGVRRGERRVPACVVPLPVPDGGGASCRRWLGGRPVCGDPSGDGCAAYGGTKRARASATRDVAIEGVPV